MPSGQGSAPLVPRRRDQRQRLRPGPAGGSGLTATSIPPGLTGTRHVTGRARQAINGTDAVRQARRLDPDVALMDVRMPVMDGLEAARQRSSPPPAARRPRVLTTFDLDQYVYEALRASASGFLLKDATPAELITRSKSSQLATRCSHPR